MNKLLSYCGLFNARIRASEKDLPVHMSVYVLCVKERERVRNFEKVNFVQLWLVKALQKFVVSSLLRKNHFLQFFLFSCGLETWYMSPGDTDWQPGQCLFTQKPAWIEEELPGNDGAFWAPALISSDIMYQGLS